MILLFLFLCPYIISSFLSPEYTSDETDLSLERESRIIIAASSETGTVHIGMEHYLLLLLPTVISPEYEEETLKAQTILLRTNLIKNYREKEELSCEYPGNILLTKEEEKKVRKAVEDTAGLYITYDGEPIYAPYFRVSAGKTRKVADVLESESYPYIPSVICPKDYLCKDYVSKTTIKKENFESIIKEYLNDINIKKCLYVDSKKDEAGYTLKVLIKVFFKNGNRKTVEIAGEVFRTLFYLPSSNMEIVDEKEKIVIHSKGIGHGLGFSQYAANELALQGKEYSGILNTFFTNIAIDIFE